MKIIYNEKRAKKRAKRDFIKGVVYISALCVGLILAIISLATDIDRLGIIGGAFILFSYFPLRFSPLSFLRPLPSAKNSDIFYFLLSQKHNILEVKVKKRAQEYKKEKLPYLSLIFVAKNKEGIVEEIFEGVLREEMSMKVEEETLDLEKGILYRPYSSEKKEKE